MSQVCRELLSPLEKPASPEDFNKHRIQGAENTAEMWRILDALMEWRATINACIAKGRRLTEEKLLHPWEPLSVDILLLEQKARYPHKQLRTVFRTIRKRVAVLLQMEE